MTYSQSQIFCQLEKACARECPSAACSPKISESDCQPCEDRLLQGHPKHLLFSARPDSSGAPAAYCYSCCGSFLGRQSQKRFPCRLRRSLGDLWLLSPGYHRNRRFLSRTETSTSCQASNPTLSACAKAGAGTFACS